MFGNVLHIERNTYIFLMSCEISGFPEVYIYCSFISHWSEQRINLQLNWVCFVCPSLFNRRYFPVHSLSDMGNEAQNLGELSRNRRASAAPSWRRKGSQLKGPTPFLPQSSSYKRRNLVLVALFLCEHRKASSRLGREIKGWSCLRQCLVESACTTVGS